MHVYICPHGDTQYMHALPSHQDVCSGILYVIEISHNDSTMLITGFLLKEELICINQQTSLLLRFIDRRNHAYSVPKLYTSGDKLKINHLIIFKAVWSSPWLVYSRHNLAYLVDILYLLFTFLVDVFNPSCFVSILF